MKSLIVVIGNPAARRVSSRKIELASIFLQKKGFNTEILLTKKRGDAEWLADEAVKKKPFLIIAAGGDGTVNEVINGIAWSDTPLSILPLGTANVLAKELAISEDIHVALETAISRTPKTVSLGKIVYHPPISPLTKGGIKGGLGGGGELSQKDQSTRHSRKGTLSQRDFTSSLVTRYFSLMAGIGFDGKTVLDVNLSFKKFSGKTAYILTGIKNLLNYHPDELFLNIDGKEYSGYCVIIGKSSGYAGNFKVTPDADLLEPTLYTCIFKGRKRSDLLRYVIGIIRGTHLKEDDILYLKSSNIEILGAAHIQVDGDYLGVTPARLSVAKDALKIVY